MEARRDFWVGLFVLTSIGVITGTLIVTSGLGEARWHLYLRTESAQDLTRDTRVLLQGLEIGRVRQLSPVADTSSGTLRFVAQLSINEKYPDGALVQLPVGTTALIAQTSPIAAPVIQIQTPVSGRRSVYLQPGDTMASTRAVNAMDRLGDVADRLSRDVEDALGQTRRLLSGTQRAVTRTDSLLELTTPLLDRSLRQLAASLERADRVLTTIEPRLGPVTDSLTLTLADTRRVLMRLDTLARTASGMAQENRETLRQTLDNLHRSSANMDHFITQVSRRPMRMLTGVKLPKADSANGGPRP